MAEVVASSLLKILFDKLSSEILKQLGLLMGMDKHLEKLQSTILTLQDVLEDAEARQVKDKSLKGWLKKLKDVAYDADDVLDNFATKAEEMRLETTSGKNKKVCSCYLKLVFRYKQARRIKEILERLDEIAEERSKFHLQGSTIEDIGVLREETGSFVNESEIFGREEDKEKIVQFLISKSSGGDLGVLAIVGMGGLGKTTVAQLAYNDEKECKDFNARMWVCVSDDFDIKRIGSSIIESLTESECKLRDMDSIQRSLVEELRGKRFLLVLDDVWDENQEKWGRLRSLLRSGAKESKIIVTTRVANVAHIMGTVPPYELPILSEDDCWNLFEERAFGLGGVNKSQNLVAIGKEIVKKCGGVPLAARALGSLMRFKKRESEWLTVKDSELWKLTDDKNDILPALMLSYNHLLSGLKQCFAYCSIFPKDYEIEKEKLVQLWIAEGFIRSSNENTHLEDMGFQYVDELLSRSLLQKTNGWTYKDEETHVKMHDLVHDLARSVAGEECSIVDASTGKGFFQSSRYSSFLFSEDISSILEPLNQANKLRTFHVIGTWYGTRTEEEQLQKLLDVIFSELKLLRALHLSKCYIKHLPGSVRNLEHLRYLDLAGANFKILPDSIGDLHNLLTFNLEGCRGLLSLPHSIGRLTSLRKLNLRMCKSLKALPESIGDLHNLLTLDLQDCNSLLSLPSSIGRLTSLRKFNLFECCSLQALPESIGDLHNLLTLDLRYFAGLMSLPDSIGGLTSLPKLNLIWCNSLQALPESIGDLHNLLTLDLPYCKSLLSLPSSIGRLTSLQKLNLNDCRSLQTLPESIGGLHNLLTLDLEECKGLLSLPDSIGRLTSLQKLNLYRCESLQALPESIGDLLNLLTLDLEDCDGLLSLPSSIGLLTSLRKLNLTCCESLHALPESVSSLQKLEELDLYCCTKLIQLPENTSNMRNLLHLNLEGCTGLTCMPAWVGQLSHLRTLPMYVLGKENQCSLGELGGLNLLEGELVITNLENVRNVAEATSANLREKHSLRSLELLWNSSEPPEMQDRDGYVVDFQEDVIESLQPHTNLERLAIDGYLGRKFASWMLESSLFNLVSISLYSCFRCERLPPFGQLPKLKELTLFRLPKFLGFDFYGGDGAFPLLDELYLESMTALEEWSGATATGGEIFPSLSKLWITDCPKLKALPFGQSPKLKKLYLSKLPAVECLGSDFYGDRVFPLLEELTLDSMPALEEWSGATTTGGEIFPSLSKLWIIDCPELQALPSTFPFVTCLEIDEGLLLSALQDGAFSNSNLRSLTLHNNNFGSFGDLPQVIKERMASINNWTDAHLTQLNSIPLSSWVSSYQLNRSLSSVQLN